ncbi:MAG: glycoside hydrolase family 92 protein, partial [Gloeobacteraceae cyanobacterium ES-bin-144]|nr:glycoside hydrolase family 92 protein [Verrucomicrobiales bacterium]
PHSGILRFTFPKNQKSRLQIDLARRVGGTSLRQTVKVVGDNTVEGTIECTPAGGGWGYGQGKVNYTLYYNAVFSKPLTSYGVWSATLPDGPYQEIISTPPFAEACRNAETLPGCREKEGQHLGFYTEFPTEEGEVVLLKAGISFVSIAGARANLAAEIPDNDFDKVHQQSRAAWAKAIGCMTVEGGTKEQQTAFYTALYHWRIDPRIFSDLNGDYPGGDGKVHPKKDFTKRTIFSGWDVYRSAFPLMTLVAPEIANDMIRSQIELAEQTKEHTFERWELFNAYSGCMIGNPMVSVISDAYLKGISRYDVAKAYEYAVNTCDRIGPGKLGYDPANLSNTTEYALHHWNLAKLAEAMGKDDDAKTYLQRSAGYKQLFDPEAPWTYDKAGKDSRPEWKGWFRTKDKNGQWDPWTGLTSEKGAVEATIYQQGWFVPHDIPGLIDLLGGKNVFVEKLTDLFERAPDFAKFSSVTGHNEVRTPYYNHANEPCHLIPFLFNRAGAPWLTQKWVRKIHQAYGVGPNGLCGDEDVGQMSAWFILAASGLHQACPGDLRFEIFSPLFDKVTLRLDPEYSKGGTFTITAQNNSPENCYVQSATLNGKPLNRCWITYQEITAGGTLDFVLGASPNKSWGVGD